MGSVNVLIWRIIAGPDSLMYGLFGNLGLDSNVSDKFLVIWPWIVLSGVVSYFFVRNITKSEIGGIVGACVFSFNTYFLSSNRAGHLLLSVAFIFATLSFFLFMKFLKERKISLACLTSLSLFITASYDFRSLYIVFGILFFYSIYHLIVVNEILEYKKIIKDTLVMSSPIILFCALSIFWVLVSLNTGTLAENSILNRSLFGNSFWNIQNTFTLFHPFWSGSAISWFVVHDIPFYFWLIPIFAYLGLILNRKNREVVFFGIISLIGIFLAKQVGEPFHSTYPWLYEHFPGFNAFREASKFYFLVIISYSVLIASFVNWLWENWTSGRIKVFSKYLITGVILFIFLWNTKPIITGEIDSMFIPRHIPQGYLILKDFILKQPEYFRTLWVPRDSRWSIYTGQKPKISSIAVTDSEWKKLVENNNEDIKLVQNRITNVFRLPFADKLFDVSSIKYVVVPLQDIENSDDFFADYGGDKNPNIRQWYIDQLDNISWLKKIDIGTKDLVVYENKGYKEPILAFTELYNFNSLDNLDSKYSFINKNLGSDFYFTGIDKNANKSPLVKITNPFENLAMSGIISDGNYLVAITSSTEGRSNDMLYIHKKSLSFFGADTGKEIQINANNGGILKLKSQSINSADTQNIFSISKVPHTQYYLQQGSELTAFIKGNTIDIADSTMDSKVAILADSANLIRNPSFEDGTWQDKVGDCNNFDANPVLGMSLSSDVASEGKQALQLEATRHNACTTTKIAIPDFGKYILTFDYQSSNAKQASFYLAFNDKEKTVVPDTAKITDAEWSTYRRFINVPYGATSATLYVYAEAVDNKTNIINRYDNFSFSKLRAVREVNIPKQTIGEYSKNSLPKSNDTSLIFTYEDKNFDYENTIDNGSFEEGTWQEKVGDCNNHDKNPILRMSLNTEEKSDGAQALQLGATRHNACLSKGLKVNSGGHYLFSFDYQSPNADHAGYYLGFNDKDKTIISERLTLKDKSWHTFIKNIKVPEGATVVSLFVYADATDGKTNILNRYDNFKIIEVPDLSDAYYLVSDPGIKLEKPKSITFDLINPTKKLVHIKGATTPFYVAMSESYHPQWQLQFDNAKIHGVFNSWTPFVKPERVGDEYHYKLNDFLNAWYVDTEAYCVNNSLCVKNADGSYDIEMVIEFFPQRWFYLGLLISGTTLLGCIGYLGYDGIKRLRRKGDKKYEKNN